MRAAASLAIALSLAAIVPAAADGGRYGHHGRGPQWGWGQQAAFGAIAQTQPQGAGSTVNIVQNGNQNGVAVVAQGSGGTTNIAQNGNNNQLTVIQLNVGARGGRQFGLRRH
jgi:hypothetical protein